MAGPDLDVVVQLLELIETSEESSCARIHCAFHIRGFFEQVRPAYVAYENEVTGEYSNRIVGGGGISDEKDNVLRGVPGSVHHIDSQVPHHEGVAVVEQLRPRFRGERILPIRVALIRKEQRGARLMCELAGSRNEVGVDVRLCYMRNAKAVIGGRAAVLSSITVGSTTRHSPVAAQPIR